MFRSTCIFAYLLRRKMRRGSYASLRPHAPAFEKGQDTIDSDRPRFVLQKHLRFHVGTKRLI
jgi:hypothetical protein